MPPDRPCPSCEASVPPDARFCPQCASPVGGAEEEASEAPSVDAAEGDEPGSPSPDPAEERRRDEALEAALRDALAPRYQLVRRLGKGGMGSVFLARDPTLKRSVAVKVLSSEVAAEDEEARRRFRREAQAVAALSHPNVVTIHNVGELEDGTPYFVMQHVAGGNMEERVEEEGPLEVAEARRVLGEVASALAAAHAKGIVHRDVKPANVLYDAETGRVLVSDFGIAAVREGSGLSGPTRLTRTGTVVGTPEYMSPEQLAGDEVTEKTDVYGLGLVAYELLTGESAYEADSPRMLFAAHLKDEPKDLGELREETDPELRQIARACLAKDPGKRPTADELVRRLEPEIGALLEWPPPGLEALQGKLLGTSLFLLGGGVAFVLPAAAMIALGVSGVAGSASFTPLALFVLGGVGLLFLVAGTVRLLLLARRAVWAVRSGYGWGTVAEVLGDFRGDTGAVVGGRREYASLGPAERGQLRRRRLLRAGGLLLAGILLPGALMAYLWAAGRGLAAPSSVWLFTLAPSLILAGGSLFLTARERSEVLDARKTLRRRRDLAETHARLVPGWHDTFRDVSADQPGTGPRRPAALGWALGSLAAAFLLAAAYLAVPVGVVAVAGGPLFELWAPRFGETRERVERVSVGRPYRLPVDTSISASEAGRAFHRLLTGTGWEPESPLEPMLEGAIEAPFPPAACRDAFGDDWYRAAGEVVERGLTGLEADELACFRELEAHPASDVFARLARAGAMDHLGTLYSLPFPEDLAFHEMPIPRYRGVRHLAAGRLGVAALRLEEGDPDGAETALREVLSVGLLLVDEGPFLIESLIGAVMAGLGLEGLEAYYAATGRAGDARSLRAARDAVEAEIDERGMVRESLEDRSDLRRPGTLRASILSGLRDPGALRGLRWEYLIQAAALPCTNPRELLFGPAPDVTEAVERAREELVRYRSEDELFRVIEESLERLPRSVDGGFPAAALTLPGRLLGNPRIEGCAVLVGLNVG